MLELSLLQSTPTIVVALAMFLLLIGFYILGYRLRGRAIQKNKDQVVEDLGAIMEPSWDYLRLLTLIGLGVDSLIWIQQMKRLLSCAKCLRNRLETYLIGCFTFPV